MRTHWRTASLLAAVLLASCSAAPMAAINDTARLTLTTAAETSAAVVGTPGGVPSPAETSSPSKPAAPEPAQTASTDTTITSDAAQSRAGISCPGKRCVSVVVTGDVLLHPPLWDQARQDAAAEGRDGLDFDPLLQAQQPYLAASDLAICHLETPIAASGEPYEGFPNFAVPAEIAPALATTGYDACSTASNHTEDQGSDGVDATLDALDAAGLKHAGSYRTAADAALPTLLNTPGGTVALIAAAYGLNTDQPPKPAWQVEIIDVPTILKQAAVARAAGADLVIVGLHAGTEYDHDPTRGQQSVAHQLLASSDVDFVYGHHAHVVQPLERIGGKWVAYGLGNTVAAHGISDLGNRQGLMVRAQFSQAADGTWSTSDIGWIPSLVDETIPYRWCPLVPESHCSADDKTSRDDIESFVDRRGASAAGAHLWSLPQ